MTETWRRRYAIFHNALRQFVYRIQSWAVICGAKNEEWSLNIKKTRVEENIKMIGTIYASSDNSAFLLYPLLKKQKKNYISHSDMQ